MLKKKNSPSSPNGHELPVMGASLPPPPSYFFFFFLHQKFLFSDQQPFSHPITRLFKTFPRGLDIRGKSRNATPFVCVIGFLSSLSPPSSSFIRIHQIFSCLVLEVFFISTRKFVVFRIVPQDCWPEKGGGNDREFRLLIYFVQQSHGQYVGRQSEAHGSGLVANDAPLCCWGFILLSLRCFRHVLMADQVGKYKNVLSWR